MVPVSILYMIIVVNVYQALLVECVNMIYVDVMIHSVEISVLVTLVSMVMLNVIVIKFTQESFVKLVR